MSKLNMNWVSDDFTVYALNDEGVNDFSFHIQGNGRKGHDPKTLKEVVAMAVAAPDMYSLLDMVNQSVIESEGEVDLADRVVAICHQIDCTLKEVRGE